MARKIGTKMLTTTALSGDGGSAFIRTPIERAMGRLMRAPDHDGGDPAGDAPAADPVVDPVDPAAPAADAKGGDPAADPDGTVLGGGDPADPADPAPVVVPETYELTAPEGVTLDPESIELATPIFKELGLDNERANKLMPVAADFANRAAAAAIAKHTLEQAGAFQSQTREWLENAKGDAEIGGQNWDKSIAASAKALDLLGLTKGTPFRTLLNETGLGNHPEMIRAFARIGERVSEDSFARATEHVAAEKNPARILYPNDKPKGA